MANLKLEQIISLIYNEYAMDSHSRKIKLGDVGYPFLLQNTFDPPETLYYKGVLPTQDEILLAVVGSRKMTPYGQAVLEKIIPPLVHADISIVSGLAYGIDTEAIRITLENNGKAYGIIGSGMDVASFYPKQNITLAGQMILKGGAIISEYPEGAPALPRNFAIRNRIIAGMCHGTLIVEAAKKSGSLITAQVAANENREVCAIPNALFILSSDGANELIKNGAHMITDVTDIFSIMGIEYGRKANASSENLSGTILDFLTSKPVHIDVVIKSGNLTPSEAGAILSELEIKGVVKNVGGMHYIRI
jgi:DNA processing protein